MSEQEPKPPAYPGHSAAFGRILSTGHDSRQNVSSIGRYAKDLMQLRDDELVLRGAAMGLADPPRTTR